MATRLAHNSNSYARGFTLIEMLVVMSLMMVMTTSFYLNFRQASVGRSALNQAAAQVISDIRRTQSLALAGSQYPTGTVVCGFGLHYVNATSYQVYVVPDRDNNGSCANEIATTVNHLASDPATTVVETRTFPNTNISITAAFSDIFFVPPDPKTYINNDATLVAPIVGDCSTLAEHCANITVQIAGQSLPSSPDCTTQLCSRIKLYTSGQLNIVP